MEKEKKREREREREQYRHSTTCIPHATGNKKFLLMTKVTHCFSCINQMNYREDKIRTKEREKMRKKKERRKK